MVGMIVLGVFVLIVLVVGVLVVLGRSAGLLILGSGLAGGGFVFGSGWGGSFHKFCRAQVCLPQMCSPDGLF
jgi:hypothetical protein